MVVEWFFRNYLQEGETVILVIHKHLFLVSKKFFKIIFFGMALPFLLWLIFPKLWIAALIWGWFGLKIFSYHLIKWYYDAWLVTDTCVLVVDWRGFFDKTSTRVEYHYTDEISYEIKGVMQTIFNYGSITLIRGSGKPLVFVGAWDPKKKVGIMLQYQDQFIRKKNFRDHKNLKQMLSEMLHLHQVKEGVTPTAIDKE